MISHQLTTTTNTPNKFLPWKMNLTASTKDYVYMAVGSEIRVFNQHIFTQDFIKSFYDGPLKDIPIAPIQTIQLSNYINDSSQNNPLPDINAIRIGEIHNNHSVLVAVTESAHVIIFSLTDNMKQSPIILQTPSNQSTWGVAIKESWIAVSSNAHDITVFNLVSGNHVILRGHTNNVPYLEFVQDPGSCILFSTSIDGSVKVWDVESGELIMDEVILLNDDEEEEESEWGWTIRNIPATPTSTTNKLCIHTTNTHVRLLAFDLGAKEMDIIWEIQPTSQWAPRNLLLRAFDRLNMVEWVEDLGLLIVASQCGVVFVGRLDGCNNNNHFEWNWERLVLEDEEDEEEDGGGVRLLPLVGVFVTRRGRKHAHVHAVFLDGKVRGWEMVDDGDDGVDLQLEFVLI